MRQLLKNFVKEESGQGMIEYVIIMALLVIAAIAALRLLGGALKDKFNTVTDELNNADGRNPS